MGVNLNKSSCWVQWKHQCHKANQSCEIWMIDSINFWSSNGTSTISPNSLVVNLLILFNLAVNKHHRLKVLILHTTMNTPNLVRPPNLVWSPNLIWPPNLVQLQNLVRPPILIRSPNLVRSPNLIQSPNLVRPPILIRSPNLVWSPK